MPQGRRLTADEIKALMAAEESRPFGETPWAPGQIPSPVAPPPAPGNRVQQLMRAGADKVRGLIPPPSKDNWFPDVTRLARGGANLVAGAIDTLSAPIENAPTIAAEAASFHPAVRGARFLTRAAAATAAAAGGSAVKNTSRALRGEQTQTPGEVVGEVALAGPVAEGVGSVASGIGRLAGNRATKWTEDMLTPPPSILDDVINPATGRPFHTSEEASKHLAEQARRRFPAERPGSKEFAHAAHDKVKDLRGQKVDHLASATQQGVRIDRADLYPDALSSRVQEIIRRAGLSPRAKDPITAVKQQQKDLFQHREIIPGGVNAQNVPVTRARASKEYTPEEVDVVMTNLDNELAKFYNQRNADAAAGKLVRPDADEAMLAETRRHIRDTLEALIPEIAPLNREMAELIPIDKAAQRAAKPGWMTARDPGINVGMGSTGPTSPRGFLHPPVDFLRGRSIRPAAAIETWMAENASKFPHLVRLLTIATDVGASDSRIPPPPSR